MCFSSPSPTEAICLISIIASAVARAALQPLATDVLERIRSKDEIRRSRERSLRRMLAAGIIEGRRLAFTAADVQLRLHHRHPVPSEERFQLAMPLGVLPLWQPDRIADTCLRQLACEYEGISLSLARSLLLAAQGWDPQLAIARLAEIERQITLRMDELNWPETEE